MARRAGCGVAITDGFLDGCYAAYTTSVTPVGELASPQGEASYEKQFTAGKAGAKLPLGGYLLNIAGQFVGQFQNTGQMLPFYLVVAFAV